LDALKWPILGVLIVGFAFGGYLLSRKSVVVSVGSEATMQTSAGTKAAPREYPRTEVASTLASLDKEASMSLDGLKDLIFKLELRRQAGTISEAEYTAERARAEQILRDLVRG
jgi:hypothetical protein